MIGREIIETELEPNGLEGYALTLRHRKLAPLSFCYEWPAPMLRDAALLTLDISRQLVDLAGFARWVAVELWSLTDRARCL